MQSRQTQNIARKTFSGIKVIGLVNGFRFLMQGVIFLVMIRFLEPTLIGQIAYIQMIVGFFKLFANINGNKLIIRCKDQKGYENLYNRVFSIEVILGLIITLIVAFNSKIITDLLHKPHISLYVAVFAFTIVLESLILVPRASFEKDLRFSRANLPLFWGVLTTGILTVVLLYFGFGIWAIINGLLIGKLTEALVLWKTLEIRPRFTIHSLFDREIFKFGVPLSLAAVVIFVYWNVDYYLVDTLLGETQLGFYYVAFRFPHYLLTGIETFSSVVFPAFANTCSRKQLRNGFGYVTRLSAYLLLLPCLITLLYGKEIVALLLGTQWLPSTRTFQIFMVLVTFRGITRHWVDILLLKGNTSIVLKISIAVTLTLIGLGYVLCYSYGIVGMALAVSLSIVLLSPIWVRKLKALIDVSYISILWKPILVSLITLVFGFIATKSATLIQFDMQCYSFYFFSIVLTVVYIAGSLWIDKNFWLKLYDLFLRRET